MGKTKNGTASVFWRDLFRLTIYKPSQGRIARQLTAVGLGVLVLAGLWALQNRLKEYSETIRYDIGIPFAVLLPLAAWVIYRLVNMPRFADFLISTEAEMNKVSWPSRATVFRTTLVVLTFMALLAVTLFLYDFVELTVLRKIGVLQIGK